MQEGVLRPVTDLYKETGPGKMNPKCNDLGSDNSLPSKVLQEQVSLVGVLHKSEAHRLVKDPRNQTGKNHYEYSECRNTKNWDLARDYVHAKAKPYECIQCRKTFSCNQTSCSTSRFTLENSLLSVKSVGKPFATVLLSGIT